MARIALNAPDNSHRPPNTGDGLEFGDNMQTVVNNLNTMLIELYAGKASIQSVNTAIATVGAGTLTGAAIAGGVITRTGSTAAFTDTTDTAAAIIAARTGATVGSAWRLLMVNNTAFTDTLAAGTGVTLSGNTVIPANSSNEFLVTFSAAGAITMYGMTSISTPELPTTQLVTNATSGAATAAVGDISGAGFCNLILTAVGAANYTTRTGAQMATDVPNLIVGMSWMVAIRNTNAGTTTVVAGASGVTINGTATIAQNTTRLFQVAYTAASTFVIQSMGTLAAAA